MAEFKTNVMRILEKNGISYFPHKYDHKEGEATDGITVASMLGENVDKVYKTLVTKSTDKKYFVFVIPAAEELDLKKAAKAVQEKSVEMIPVKEILSLIHIYLFGQNKQAAR